MSIRGAGHSALGSDLLTCALQSSHHPQVVPWQGTLFESTGNYHTGKHL